MKVWTNRYFYVDRKPEPVIFIENIASYNQSQGLALSDEEIMLPGTVTGQAGPEVDRQRSLRVFTGEFGALQAQDLQWHLRDRRERDAGDSCSG